MTDQVTPGRLAGTRSRLVMWDIDQTLLRSHGVTAGAFVDTVSAMIGRPAAYPLTFAGRTDLDTALEMFAAHGVDTPDLDDFFVRYAATVQDRRDVLRERATALAGAAEALAAVGARPDVVQTVVTGNIRPVAEIKLATLGLDTGIDFEVGGYGTDDGIRATLVRMSRQRARARYGAFDEVLVVGDTPLDVAGALANGVTAVGVATGTSTAAELKAAGAHHVLESLADTTEVVRLLTGQLRE
jgi:phosphoglycolate phosphatase-like HAD superfamily hydrolase